MPRPVSPDLQKAARRHERSDFAQGRREAAAGTIAGATGPSLFTDAFSLMPVPAMLVDDVRLVATNRAASQLLEPLENPRSLLQAIRALLSRPGGSEPAVRVGPELFHVSSTRLSTYSSLRLWLLLSGGRADRADPYGSWSLSVPERRVAAWLERGLGNREIAEELGLSIETIRKHVAHILAKSGARTRAAFVALLLRQP